MITEQEAVQRAWNLVRRENLRVRDVQSVRRIPAAALPSSRTARGDCWAILFTLDIPADEVWSPDSFEVDVDCDTGETTVIPGL